MTKEMIQVEDRGQKTITDGVLARVNEMQGDGSIRVPANYSPANALKSAYLILVETKDKSGKSVLATCTPASITSALLDMVIQGLNPSKNQCYFIAYGNQLQMSRSYLGTMALTKRIPGVKDVKGFAVYKGDDFQLGYDFLKGTKKVEKYVPNVAEWENENLIGAIALIIGDDNEQLHVEYMTMEQIRAAWEQGATKGNSPAHKKFPDQMAIKSVINRACKYYANTSDDSEVSDLMAMTADREIEAEIGENANKDVLTLDEEYIEVEGQVVNTETGEIIPEPEEPAFTIDDIKNDVPF